MTRSSAEGGPQTPCLSWIGESAAKGSIGGDTTETTLRTGQIPDILNLLTLKSEVIRPFKSRVFCAFSMLERERSTDLHGWGGHKDAAKEVDAVALLWAVGTVCEEG
jgi:hypothetical protein